MPGLGETIVTLLLLRLILDSMLTRLEEMVFLPLLLLTHVTMKHASLANDLDISTSIVQCTSAPPAFTGAPAITFETVLFIILLLPPLMVPLILLHIASTP